jgi:hypothetical protein
MISFPTYKIATGIADFAIRNTAFPNISRGLVSQTNRKNRGKFPSALTRSLHVNGATPVEVFDLICPLKVPLFSLLSFFIHNIRNIPMQPLPLSKQPLDIAFRRPRLRRHPLLRQRNRQ